MNRARTTTTACFFLSFLAQCAMAQGDQQTAQCYGGLLNHKPLAPLASKLVLSGEPKATLEMQANDSKVTAAEKEALQVWAPLRDGCFEMGMKWLEARSAPQWLRSITLQTKDSSDALVSLLYRGEITFGQFNVGQMALSADTRKRLDAAAETFRREQGTATPTPPVAPAPAVVNNNPQQDRYQCEQDAARAYPPMMVQRMTDPGFQAPSSSNSQTDCTMVGAQMTCRSTRAGADASIYNRPPSYVNEDRNALSRVSTFRSCMAAKGYTAN